MLGYGISQTIPIDKVLANFTQPRETFILLLKEKQRKLWVQRRGKEKDKMPKVKCPKCEYEWETKAKLNSITCPNCQRKFDRPKEGKKSLNISED